MTGFKDRLKDALSDFVEFDEAGTPLDERAHPNKDTEDGQRTTNARPEAQALPELTDPEMLTTLQTAVACSTLSAYEQFQTLYAAMDSVTDERLRYDVSLKALRASHQLGPDAVLAAVEDRLRLLDVERERFDAALGDETERSVNGTNRQIASIGDTIAARQKEIRDLEARQATLHEAAKAAQVELDRSRVAFGAAYSTVHSGLDAERVRVSTHIAAGK